MLKINFKLMIYLFINNNIKNDKILINDKNITKGKKGI